MNREIKLTYIGLTPTIFPPSPSGRSGCSNRRFA